MTGGNSSCSLFPSYLSEEDVLDQENPFIQLVSGVVWLLRDGEVYVGQSQKAECDETQTTGKYRKASACAWIVLMRLLEGGGTSGSCCPVAVFAARLRGQHLFCAALPECVAAVVRVPQSARQGCACLFGAIKKNLLRIVRSGSTSGVNACPEKLKAGASCRA